ncbi:glycoside hydrolase family 19 protein [Dickeya solani]|uniref:Glycoside hydrolase family 19 protein n=1 Tax=Dickeya solani TaxID=1089444 RepID=A0ABU4EIN5_9GAMM|nr:glycoside hydrolase family 19 protein [Dickeya solani]MCA6999505.1 glycoside hydrolase family 19 protein [Dickeya solani]MCZ0823776.1 glycoside hydrolase family 19 protein [Dickeya solani]MDV6996235.1 glycoside hydrolase family 19 protein [Dickeya solani]MDV7005370.1 glycoside hydrolase family 19 protein [Dickeya solani]MDV7037590.1 glycoside hydrolase family 19 protein [Dickeya solani]
MNQNQFQSAAGISAGLAARWHPHLIATFAEFGITASAQAMFIAQVGHESGGFSATIESFNYSQQALLNTFASRLGADQIAMLGRQRNESAVPQNRQAAIANLVYGGRLGNKAAGDGWKFRGRGLIQITGLDNYRACGAGLKLDLVSAPELLEQDVNAMRSAGWYWMSRCCSRYADDVERVTLLINGGRNGLDDRRARYDRATQALS